MTKLKGLTVVGKIQLQPTKETTTASTSNLEKLIHKTSKRCFVNKVHLAEEVELVIAGLPALEAHEKATSFLNTYPVNRVNQKASFLVKQQIQKEAAKNIRKYGAAFKK